jgi:hypothetical protein
MGVIGKASRKIGKAIGFIETVEVSDADKDLLETIRTNVLLDGDATEQQLRLEEDDLRFCDPTTQWTDDDRNSREASGRPCLTEDLIGSFIRQVCNEQRKNKPGVTINPVDDGADDDTAEVIQGLVRHIEYSSNADTAYDTAFQSAVRTGRGFYRLCTDYVDTESDDQEIQIKRVPNSAMVFIDPAAQESDFSDARWGGFKTWMSRDDYKASYGESGLGNAGSSAWRSIGDDAPDWMSGDGGACMVVEYIWKETTKSKTKSGRETQKIQIKWVKCTAVEILERGELPGIYIPIIPVLGDEIIQNGQRTWSGIVRAGKDPQKRHNYLLTSQIERIAFTPLATWMGVKGFMGKDKTQWQNAHKAQTASLEYEPVDIAGNPAPPPQMVTQEAAIQSVTVALQGSEIGMKAVLGMYDANMGNNQGSDSGIAIQRLQTQGDTGNFHFQDNLSRAIRLEGRVVLSWLSTYYSRKRVIRIIGEDGSQTTVKINGKINTPEEAMRKEQVGKIFDLTTGKYDVTISTGPSYQSKRQEDRAMLQAMLQGPMGQQLAQRAGDLVAKTLDSPIAAELAERLMPPDIAAKQQQGNAPQIPPQMQQQMQALMQQHQQLVQALHEAQNQLESKQSEIQMKNDADMAKAQLDSQTKLQIAQMNNEATILIAEAQIAGNGILPELQKTVNDLKSQQEDLAQLALAHHAALSGPVTPPDGSVPPTPPAQPSAPMGAPNPSTPQIASAGPMAGTPASAQPQTAGPQAGME